MVNAFYLFFFKKRARRARFGVLDVDYWVRAILNLLGDLLQLSLRDFSPL